METTFVIETAYEILQKPCSVETCVRTKILQMQRIFSDRFFLVGPATGYHYRMSQFFSDLRQDKSLNIPLLKAIQSFEKAFKLPERSVQFGKLLYPGVPYCVLLPTDFDSKDKWIAPLYQKALGLMRKHKVDVTIPELKKKFAFGFMQWCFYSHLLTNYFKDLPEISRVIIQSHEWTSHIGTLLLRNFGNNILNTAVNQNMVKTVLTVHQSVLGREITNKAEGQSLHQLYQTLQMKTDQEIIQSLEEEARKLNVINRHILERCCAEQADVVTGISDLCCQEAEWILNAKPKTTNNGLNVAQIRGEIDDHELISNYNQFFAHILEFVRIQFQNYQNLKTYFFFMSGGNEIVNKGFDVFFDALAYVNKQLSDENFLTDFPDLRGKNVVAFIISPAKNKGLTTHSSDGTNMLKDMELSIEKMVEELQQKLVKKMCSSESLNFGKVELSQLLDADDLLELTRYQQLAAQHMQNSPLTTHELEDPDAPFIQYLKKVGLDNKQENKVKVLWIPEYLTSTSVLGIDYLQFIKGCDLGCFASKYDPFGYTSPECMSVGTPSIVSDLAGFGVFIQKMVQTTESIEDNVVTRSQKIQQKATDDEQKAKDKRVASFGHLNDAVSQSTPTNQQEVGRYMNPWVESKFGVHVVGRQREASVQRTVLDIGAKMLEIMRLKRHEAVGLRTRASHNAVVCDWSVQIEEYLKVYEAL